MIGSPSARAARTSSRPSKPRAFAAWSAQARSQAERQWPSASATRSCSHPTRSVGRFTRRRRQLVQPLRQWQAGLEQREDLFRFGGAEHDLQGFQRQRAARSTRTELDHHGPESCGSVPGEPARPDMQGHEIELVGQGAPEGPIGLAQIVGAGVHRTQGAQDPAGVSNILQQHTVEHLRGRVGGRFGRGQALRDDHGELPIGVSDMPAENVVALGRSGADRPNETHHSRSGWRSRGIEPLAHRRDDGVPESTDRPRGGFGRTRVSERREGGRQRESVAGLDRVEGRASDGHVVVLEEGVEHGPVRRVERLEGLGGSQPDGGGSRAHAGTGSRPPGAVGRVRRPTPPTRRARRSGCRDADRPPAR